MFYYALVGKYQNIQKRLINSYHPFSSLFAMDDSMSETQTIISFQEYRKLQLHSTQLLTTAQELQRESRINQEMIETIKKYELTLQKYKRHVKELSINSLSLSRKVLMQSQVNIKEKEGWLVRKKQLLLKMEQIVQASLRTQEQLQRMKRRVLVEEEKNGQYKEAVKIVKEKIINHELQSQKAIVKMNELESCLNKHQQQIEMLKNDQQQVQLQNSRLETKMTQIITQNNTFKQRNQQVSRFLQQSQQQTTHYKDQLKNNKQLMRNKIQNTIFAVKNTQLQIRKLRRQFLSQLTNQQLFLKEFTDTFNRKCVQVQVRQSQVFKIIKQSSDLSIKDSVIDFLQQKNTKILKEGLKDMAQDILREQYKDLIKNTTKYFEEWLCQLA